jgi:hypothetical protein
MAESTIMLTDSTMPQGKRVAVNAPVRDRHRKGRYAPGSRGAEAG